MEPFPIESPEKWPAYEQRLLLYLELYRITAMERKTAFLFSFCGWEVFKLAKTLLVPSKLEEVPFEDIVKVLRDHFARFTPSVLVQRFKFYHRFQGPTESITDYMVALREVAVYCQFPKFEESLRDQLVRGMRDKRTQKRLLSTKPDPSYRVAMEEALSEEAVRALTREGRAQRQGLRTKSPQEDGGGGMSSAQRSGISKPRPQCPDRQDLHVAAAGRRMTSNKYNQ